MSFSPFGDASLIIQIHAIFATLALILGPIAIYQKRRSTSHKIVGYTWVIAMGSTALSSFGIHSFDVIWGFSPIHGLAILALWSLWHAMRAIFRGDVQTHKAEMCSLYWHGLCFAGLFNFLPNRMVNRMFFGAHEDLGYLVIALGVALILLRMLRSRQTMRRIKL